MKFSLIVPTLNRVQELDRLFQSLVSQNYDDFEVIIIDQNLDNRLVKLVDAYREYFPILHIKESKRGQSHARNVGFSHVQGEIAAFPDDDCLYTEGLLTKIADFFVRNPTYDGLMTRVFDLEEDKNAFEPCGDAQSCEVDYAKAYKDCVSPAMFFRAPIAKRIAFNEALGVGANTPWGCGEETDYLFQCLDAGYRFYYEANFIVRHPNPLKKNDFRIQIKREYNYGLGKGYFLSTHQLPKALLKYEYKAPYRQTLSEISIGNWRRASYCLINGIATTLGYWYGRKKS